MQTTEDRRIITFLELRTKFYYVMCNVMWNRNLVMSAHLCFANQLCTLRGLNASCEPNFHGEKFEDFYLITFLTLLMSVTIMLYPVCVCRLSFSGPTLLSSVRLGPMRHRLRSHGPITERLSVLVSAGHRRLVQRLGPSSQHWPVAVRVSRTRGAGGVLTTSQNSDRSPAPSCQLVSVAPFTSHWHCYKSI